ncbi:peroxisomal catalase 1-like [Bicyclus anynana]|uniref:Peroxisomal catalase 1-like n=1 Tax=Bicyclus anynana TaxID=110368 RepID=A0A6J1NLV0_BICAN|nr:peroxisomal catalase 1-like [Bicyclus anynana]
MLAFWILLALSVVVGEETPYHPAVDQALLCEIRKKSPEGVMSISSGAPVSIEHATTTLNMPLIHNHFFMDVMTNQVRERPIDRTVHPKGTGAFGYFEVTHDISDVCRAKLFNEIGKRTPVAVRISPATAERGASELARGVRGFAIKFYTEDGILDFPGLNLDKFFSREPTQFVKFAHSLRRDPAVYIHNPLKLLDTILQVPESLNMLIDMFGDRGIPKSYRHISHHNIHTMQVENAYGDTSFIRFHCLPDEGHQFLTDAEIAEINLADPDYYTRDLHDSIKKGDFPNWTCYVQIATEEDAKRLGFRLFDVTRKLPEDEFPLYPVGKMVLNRNPKNVFAEVEQLAFCPGNLVDGINGGPDRVFQARRFSYNDAHLYRLGPHVKEIPVNCPFQGRNVNPDSVNSEPVSWKPQQKGLLKVVPEDISNFDQARDTYENMSEGEKTRLHGSLIGLLTPASPSVRNGMIELFEAIHPDLGGTLAERFNSTMTR